MTTENKNLLIAEFMGGMDYVHEAHFPKLGRHQMGPLVSEVLRFHESWDWLMPVVLRIGPKYDIRFQDHLGCYCATIFKYPNPCTAIAQDPLVATYGAVVGIIERINKGEA